MRDRTVRLGALRKRLRRARFGLLVLAVVGGVGLIVGPAAFGTAAGPVLSVDEGFNSGQPVAPQWPPDAPGGSTGGTLFASAIQPDGKVIVVGQNAVGSPGNPTIVRFDAARYNADGTLDTSFGTNGYVQVAPTANGFNFADAVVLDPQTGDIVIAGGDIGNQDVPELVRLTPSGALDPSFGGGSGWVVDNAGAGSYLTGVVIDSSSRIVTIGTDGVVRRYAGNGSPDSGFGTNGHTGVVISPSGGFGFGTNALALQPDGQILIAGTSSAAGGTVVRLNGTDGSLDPTFGSGGTASLAPGTAIYQIALQGTTIGVGGNDASGNGMVARLTSTGALDTSFGTAGSGYDTFTPPSGDTEHVDALFYDPNPGWILCVYQDGAFAKTKVCFSLDVNGVPTGSTVNPPGPPKNGGQAFKDGLFDEGGYEGVTVYNATDNPGTNGGGGGGGGGTGTTPGTTPPTTTCTHALRLDKVAAVEAYDGFGSYVWDSALGKNRDYVVSGAKMRYRITVTNTGTCPATNIAILDSLPSAFHLTPNGASVFPPKGNSVTETPNPRGGGSLSADIPALAGAGTTRSTALAAGSEVIVDVEGVESGPGPLVNTATATYAESSMPVLSNTVKLAVDPDPRISSPTANAKGVAGSANAGGAPPRLARDASTAAASAAPRLAAVYIAIRKVAPGCNWLKNTRAQFRRRACSTPTWLKAHGTTRWQLHFQEPLPPGRYDLLIKAVNRDGVFDTIFSLRQHNLLVFRVH